GVIMHLWVHSADAGAAWTRGLIERIESGAYTFEGEGNLRRRPRRGSERTDRARSRDAAQTGVAQA
ncbi:MAG TPA: hypothetical protein VIU87_01900, partial [Mycobacterium sp.]